MTSISVAQLDLVCGGAQPLFEGCRQGVAKAAATRAGKDGVLDSTETGYFVGSVLANGVHPCERAGLQDVAANQLMTPDARRLFPTLVKHAR